MLTAAPLSPLACVARGRDQEAAKLEVLEVSTDGVDLSPAGLAPLLATTVQPYVEQGGAAYNYHPTEAEAAAAAAAARAEEVRARLRGATVWVCGLL